MASPSSLLCLFQGDPSELPALDAAFDLARQFGSVLRVLHVSIPPMEIVDPYGAGAYTGLTACGPVIDRLVADEEILITSARAYVADAAARFGVKLCHDEKGLALAGGAAVLFIVGEDMARHIIELYGKTADVIVSALNAETLFPAAVGVMAALLDSGKPVLLLPADGRKLDFEHVAVAWDGSPKARRALEAATALLSRETSVHLVCVAEEGQHRDMDIPSAEADLRRAGLGVVVERLSGASSEVGSLLLGAASACGAGLLVIGAYGHNRTAEALFGGTSRYVLRHAGVPLLMVH